ncbi:E3 ubiquitin/ISG15 ligase TRIM25-like isoform X2 [Trematomus bernacchii]|uniref:E3 ubiquitin/ISG15 ligase TRIM25-like isoform X2 n=1 Tax=Trematomus bernacchii TaxID=40690 RepID=UPI00146A8C31|nr:E3 ubiquitin/ISG15 ligase TRIM25-like isoform X2 [Trematomus bernacchii]
MMAAMDQSPFSLLSLEEELSCSICLCPFDCPVTIPCGHNFCQDCLLASWKDSYSCPQCRTHFPTKPELKKNTVLSTLVETFNLRTTKSEADLGTAEDSQAESQDVIRCDTCMEAEAAQTCLTCMASFCEEHLRPHRENPRFRVHQLSEPVGDLSERICPDHHKLMELFCSQHCRPICSLCLQLVHKGCSFMSPEEQRNLKEDAATKRKTALAAVYQQIRDMLVQEEQNAQHEVDSELEIGQTKLQDHMKRLTVNTEKMTKARESINNLLSQSQTMAFLQASFNLPKAVKFDPHMPQVNLDSKKVTASQACSAALKQHLAEILKQPVEARLLTFKPEQKAETVSGPATKSTGSQPEDITKPPKQRRAPRSRSVGRPPIQPLLMPFNVPINSFMGTHTGWHWNPPYMAGQQTKQDRRPPHNAPGGYKPNMKGNQ